MATVSYTIRKMRVVRSSAKIAAKYPERLFTVHGVFHANDDKGKPLATPLTITSKVIERADALDPVFALDIEKGTLTLPAGERGRKASVGESADSIAAMLAALTAPAADATPVE